MPHEFTELDIERIKLRSAATRIIEEIREYPKKLHENPRRDWLAPPTLDKFKHLEPLGWGITYDNWGVFHPDIVTPDLVWPVQVSTVSESPECELAMQQMRTVTLAEVRKYIKHPSPFMVRMDIGQVVEGEMWLVCGLMSWVGGKWIDAMDGTFSEHDNRNVKTMTSVALQQRYEWSVSFALPRSPSIRFRTDPTGVKDLFRLRAMPEGKDRRDALLNWVSDHWRQNRHDPDIETYVRKHLRGATIFEWSGFTAEIVPAKFDVEKNSELAIERNAMRRSGADKRRRLFRV